jgi:hypothetical protein
MDVDSSKPSYRSRRLTEQIAQDSSAKSTVEYVSLMTGMEAAPSSLIHFIGSGIILTPRGVAGFPEPPQRKSGLPDRRVPD